MLKKNRHVQIWIMSRCTMSRSFAHNAHKLLCTGRDILKKPFHKFIRLRMKSDQCVRKYLSMSWCANVTVVLQWRGSGGLTCLYLLIYLTLN